MSGPGHHVRGCSFLFTLSTWDDGSDPALRAIAAAWADQQRQVRRLRGWGWDDEQVTQPRRVVSPSVEGFTAFRRTRFERVARGVVNRYHYRASIDAINQPQARRLRVALRSPDAALPAGEGAPERAAIDRPGGCWAKPSPGCRQDTVDRGPGLPAFAPPHKGRPRPRTGLFRAGRRASAGRRTRGVPGNPRRHGETGVSVLCGQRTLSAMEVVEQ